MRKALFLSHIPLYPVIGGDRIRLSQMLKLLCHTHHTDVICISHHHGSERSIKGLINGVANEKWFYVPRFKRYLNAAKTLLNDRPELDNHYWHRHVQRYIDSIAADYDVILCGSPAMAAYLRNHSDKNIYLDFTDSLTLNYEHATNVSHGLKRIWKRLNAKRMRKLEQRYREMFVNTAYISTRDRDYIGTDTRKTCIVKNFVDMPAAALTCNHNPAGRDIVFVGKMNYGPNIEACRYFALEVFPKVKMAIPDAQFIIVGTSPTAEVRDLASASNGITVTGRVESPSEFYRSAAIVCAPMVSGSGLQNKILEAMAYGCAVVTTPIGAGGFTEVPDSLALCNDSDTMANSCIDLLNTPARRAALGKDNRHFIDTHYSEQAALLQFQNFICNNRRG